ncbi:MAG TPA: HAMP domain-containing protein, partial [Gemmatimonadales bacterium]|nr:HAMP domain-containing protein [Gemmatimonadales bacterium]
MTDRERRRISGAVRAIRSARSTLRHSLVVRLAASFTALSVLVVLLTGVVVHSRTRTFLQRALLDRLAAIAEDKQGELNLLVEHQRGNIAFLSGLAELRSEAARLAALPPGPEAEALRSHLTAKLDSARSLSGELEELFLLGLAGGRVLASTQREHLGEYRVHDPYYESARQRLTVTNVYTSPQHGRPALTIASPVLGPGGQPVALLGGHVDLTRIDEILAPPEGGWTTAEAYLVTTLNDFVSSARFGRPEARRGIHTHAVREALAARSGAARYVGYRGEEVLGAWRWIPARQLALVVEITAAEAFAPAQKMLLTVLAIGLVASMVLGVGTWLLARRITKPLVAVADTAVRVAEGDFDARAPVVTQDEVGMLARTFNAMTERVQRLVDDLSDQVEETRRAIRALQENQQLLHSVVDNSANLILALDAGGRFLLVNQHFSGLFGRSESEVRGEMPESVLPPEPGRTVGMLARRVIEDRRVAEQDLDVQVGHVVLRYRLVAFPLREE